MISSSTLLLLSVLLPTSGGVEAVPHPIPSGCRVGPSIRHGGEELPSFTCKYQLPPGGCSESPVLLELFRFERKLGEGSFGRVDEMRDFQNSPLAVKTVMAPEGVKGLKWKGSVEGEAKMGFAVGLLGEEFVDLEAVFMFSNGACLLMEKAGGGDLFEFLGKFLIGSKDRGSPSGRAREDVARWIAKGLLEALQKTRVAGIELGDLKLENVMLDRPFERFMEEGGSVKIVDFGLSQFYSSSRRVPFRGGGTEGYLPPSCSLRDPWKVVFLNDMYAVSVILLKLLVGAEFFFAFGVARDKGDFLKGKTVKEKVVDIPTFWISELAKDFLMTIANIHTLQDPSTLLQHPWFQAPVSALRGEVEEKLKRYEMEGGGEQLERVRRVRRHLLPPLDSVFEIPVEVKENVVKSSFYQSMRSSVSRFSRGVVSSVSTTSCCISAKSASEPSSSLGYLEGKRYSWKPVSDFVGGAAKERVAASEVQPMLHCQSLS